MIGKLNSTPAFKGTILFNIGRAPLKFDTKQITNIQQCEKQGYTGIATFDPIFNAEFHKIPTSVVSTADILAAYSAANSSDFLVVELEDKKSK